MLHYRHAAFSERVNGRDRSLTCTWDKHVTEGIRDPSNPYDWIVEPSVNCSLSYSAVDDYLADDKYCKCICSAFGHSRHLLCFSEPASSELPSPRLSASFSALTDDDFAELRNTPFSFEPNVHDAVQTASDTIPYLQKPYSGTRMLRRTLLKGGQFFASC